MMARTQITLPPEQHRRARERARELRISLAEYVRRAIDRDLGAEGPMAPVDRVFALGRSEDADVASRKDRMLGEAAAAIASGGRQSGRRE